MSPSFLRTFRQATLLGAVFCTGLALSAQAQTPASGFSYSGMVRARYEALEGQSRAGLGASDDVFSLRSQVLAEYRQPGWRIGAELYDSRTYGAGRGSANGANDVNAVEMVQAYGIVDGLEPFAGGPKLALQAGRFTMPLGSRRLIAAEDYRNTNNGFTGLKADARWTGGTSATAFYVLPQQRRPDSAAAIRNNSIALDHEGFDQQMWGGIVTRPGIFGAIGDIAYYGFAEKDTVRRPTRNRNLHSFDAHLIQNPAVGKWDYEAEAILQTGSVRSSAAAAAPQQDVSAWFGHFDFGYTFAVDMKPRLSFEYDYASGGSSPTHSNRFDTLYGMRRADFAPGGFYGQIGRANISTPGVRLEMEVSPRLDLFAVYRAMWLANSKDAFSTSGVVDATGRSGDFAGHQLEGRVRWWVIPQDLRLEVNAAWLAKGAFLKNAPNAPRTGDTRYVSVALITQF